MPRIAPNAESRHKIIFLDEPTTGLDPQTKRLIWKSIQYAAKQNTVILTTHSMEEADAICTRVGIVVAGQLRALGSPYHLKEKHGNYYRILMQGSRDGIAETVNRLYEISSKVSTIDFLPLENNDFYAELRLDQTYHLSSVHAALSEARSSGLISYFSFRYATLEDVFLGIANTIEPPQETAWDLGNSQLSDE